ncbi:IS5 family transposase [Skermanella aerolata]|uniref:IS5 family transposase n=1 Tax=Skermanella aerolata TaxID=393310 RepID=UPI003D1D03E3
MTLRAVFRLALRQTEGLVGSLLELMGLDLPVPDHSTLSRRSRTLAVAPHAWTSGESVHLLVDSTGVKLSGPGEWLVEKHGTQRRRAWRKLHLVVNAKTGTIVASTLTTKGVDDAAELGALLDQVDEPLGAVIADGAYDQDRVYYAVARALSGSRGCCAAASDGRTQSIGRHRSNSARSPYPSHCRAGPDGLAKTSGYNARARAEIAAP